MDPITWKCKEQRLDNQLEPIYNSSVRILEDLPRTMDNRDEWRERVREIHASGVTWWWWWWNFLKNQPCVKSFQCREVGKYIYESWLKFLDKKKWVWIQSRYLLIKVLLHIYRWVMHISKNECFGYDTKQSSFRECGVTIPYHYTQLHSDLES